ncbi:Bifunctional P-450/NADPH-P450 reductase [Mycena kentingensis (nom. inval.)]|nr:Bifunctional P-450/NADPH-P450 reductase [Mycena kentingensis (nom. inval.)]
MIYTLVPPLGATFFAYLLYHILQIVYAELKSPLKRLPGPKNGGFIVGNFMEMTGDSTLTTQWRAAFGPVFRYKNLFSLRDLWSAQLSANGGQSRIDVSPWSRKVTLDIIGKAGFNYDFASLAPDERPNELNDVFPELLHSPRARMQTGFRLAQAIIPVLRLFPVPGQWMFARAKATMFRISRDIFLTSKAHTTAEEQKKEYSEGKRDILSILLKANMSEDVGPSYRLTDDEVVAQIPTFLLAGHETTSTTLTWALHALSLNPAAQSKLRAELSALATDHPDMDQLNALQYLENVVREVLRIHSPVIFTQRMAMCEDVLPLGAPVVDRDGRVHESLRIPKGQMIHIPVQDVNRDVDIWGADAAEFKPERWDNLPDAVRGIPGIWPHLLTFLAGPHHCIGFKFSLVENKALLYTLIREFEFAPGVPKGDIRATAFGFQRPYVATTPELGSSLPLIVSKVVR